MFEIRLILVMVIQVERLDLFSRSQGSNKPAYSVLLYPRGSSVR